MEVDSEKSTAWEGRKRQLKAKLLEGRMFWGKDLLALLSLESHQEHKACSSTQSF